MGRYFGFNEYDLIGEYPLDVDRILEGCRFHQLLTENQYAHIQAARKDKNARVLCSRDKVTNDLRFIVVYDVRPVE